MSEEQSLKDKTAKGLFWGGFSNGIQQLLNLVFGIFIARLLTPSDYGMVGMLAIFSLIAGSIQESGFTAALVNKKEVTHKDYNAVFWFNIITSLCLYLVLFLCAPLIAYFYKVPELTPLARYSFTGFFIASLGISHSAYLKRNLMVKQQAMSSVIGLTVSGIAGVTLAYLGFSYWGYATQSIVYVAVNTACYWHFTRWRPTLQFSLAPIKEMFGFSGKLLITNIFNHINNNLFSVILGKYYSKIEVGYYNQSNKWCGMGQQFILGMINGVAQPVLAKISEDTDRQQRVFRKMLRFTAFISFPAMLGLGIIAEELIVISITDKWYSSVSIMQILCISGAFVPIANLYQQLIISKGKSRIFMWNIIILGMILLTGVLLVHSYGIYAMLAMYVSTNILWLLRGHHFVQLETTPRTGRYSSLRHHSSLRHGSYLLHRPPYRKHLCSPGKQDTTGNGTLCGSHVGEPFGNFQGNHTLFYQKEKRMKLLALVTLYYPPAHITDNLLTYAEDVDGLFVWDNTPGGSNYQFPESISHKIVRLRQGENTGIGKALNAAAMFALDNGYTYLLTMDQDSAFTASTFKDYIRIINNDKDSSHFAYIPLINASGTDSNAPLKEAQGMIISGSIFPLRTIQKVGLYLDKFVMDAIDTEYFLRIRRHTGKVMLVPAANLKHELGHPLRKQILIWHPMSLNYSPVRTYYIARNFLYLNKQYAEFKRPELLWKLIWERPFYILFMEENKWEKLKALAKGIWQGWRKDLNHDCYFKKLNPNPKHHERE